jgi:protein involved in polysaccharide export with SLBB domain
MDKLLSRFIIFLTASIITGCSQVLEPIELDIDARDTGSQEDFKVLEKTLTLSEAQLQNSKPFTRKIIQNGIGKKAQVLDETYARQGQFPEIEPVGEYKMGIGDTLSFTKLTESSNISDYEINSFPDTKEDEPYVLGIGDQIALIQVNEGSSSSPNLGSSNIGSSNDVNLGALAALGNLSNEKDVVQTTGRIGSDGSVLLLEVGRLEAVGKTINDLRSEVRNILIRNGISPKFQLEITAFNSQKAYLTINSNNSSEDTNEVSGAGGIIKLTDQPLTLREILSQSGVILRPGVETLIKIQRSNSVYSFELGEVYEPKAKEIIIKDRDHIFVEVGISDISKTVVKVGSDGHILLSDLGKLNVLGKTIKELENEIRTELAHTSKRWKSFQFQVEEFNSQRIILNIPKLEVGNNIPSRVIILNDKKLRLDEVLTENGVSIQQNKLTKIHLQRGSEKSSFLLSDLLLDPNKIVYLKDKDRIRVERLSYKKSKVFVIGSGLKPQIFNISPENRETLADALFTQNGALASTSAKRSDIYLLRGRNPVTAFHLDALSPSRLLVAEAMELRPNDIIFVSEQPIISFNRTLQTLFPLRILLRDIDNQNIP